MIHHRSLADRRPSAGVGDEFRPRSVPAFGDKETDGLSRNPNDCATYGCVDSGG